MRLITSSSVVDRLEERDEGVRGGGGESGGEAGKEGDSAEEPVAWTRKLDFNEKAPLNEAQK